ncbi:MAG TPA: septum site-determining protein MinC, partial [Rhodocyclaceae bacterium]|nr:septum site-determining protein MinC [Rhodocyclaceae bacterium]
PKPAPEPAPAAVTPPPAPAAVPTATLVVDKPLRSGQQVYAKGGDLVLLAGVSPGAEVIADGSIHCYGPLRGRALAGARGDHTARIFSTNFGPELVSIAGVYRTFERGIPQAVAGRGTQVRLTGSDALHTLEITPLATD